MDGEFGIDWYGSGQGQMTSEYGKRNFGVP
jgi:hypothetical protein